MAHRIEPLHGTMNTHTKKKAHDAQRGDPQSYAHMLSKVMAGIHEYLWLSYDNKKSRTLKSFKLVGSIARQRDDNMICICLQDAKSEH